MAGFVPQGKVKEQSQDILAENLSLKERMKEPQEAVAESCTSKEEEMESNIEKIPTILKKKRF